MSDQTNSPSEIATLDVSGGSTYVPPEASIGDRIKEARKNLGISVEQLSDLTSRFDHEARYADGSGISIPSLYRYEKGDRLPGAREMRLLCEALKVSPNWLLLGQAHSPEESEYGQIGRALCSLIDRAEQLNKPSGGASSDLLHGLKLSEVKAKSK